jgi:hypothetical protein
MSCKFAEHVECLPLSNFADSLSRVGRSNQARHMAAARNLGVRLTVAGLQPSAAPASGES